MKIMIASRCIQAGLLYQVQIFNFYTQKQMRDIQPKPHLFRLSGKSVPDFDTISKTRIDIKKSISYHRSLPGVKLQLIFNSRMHE